MDMPSPVPKKSPVDAPLRVDETRLPDPGREPGIVAFAVLKEGKDYVPTKLLLEDAVVTHTAPCGPRGIYEPTSYEYLTAAVMDHYRLKTLGRS